MIKRLAAIVLTLTTIVVAVMASLESREGLWHKESPEVVPVLVVTPADSVEVVVADSLAVSADSVECMPAVESADSVKIEIEQ